MWTALIGILGVLLGASLNELLRRKSRIEVYTVRVFDKRLEKYEELIALMKDASEVATDVMENPEYTPEQRHELILAAIWPIAQFTEDNELYIDPELAPHCVATFMGAEDIQSIKDPQEREERSQEIRDMYVNAKRMIREDSGITEIDKLFKKMTKPRLSSPIIERIRYLKAHQEEVRKFHKEETTSTREIRPEEVNEQN